MERILQIEAPDMRGTLSFISRDVVVSAEIKDGKLIIDVTCSKGETSSEFTYHDFDVELPEYTCDEEG